MKDKLDVYESIDALATTMTKNYCIDQLRKQKNLSKTDINNLEWKSNDSPSPHRLMEISESDNLITAIIENLEEKYKVVVKMREFDDLSYEEIAEITGQNVNTLRVILSRARSYIREEYNNYTNEKSRVKYTS
jgi:RNA polymerase sigma-70 factor (ECF subfamily)